MGDGRLECELCPRLCKLNEGQRGHCFVRQRIDDQLILTTYGRSSGFCVDPIEKKPLNHFYPGSSVLSFGTAGCNLACRFCQNWDISTSKDTERLSSQALPWEIAKAAVDKGCRSVAFTYNDPVIFAEYAMDVADACHAVGVKTVAVTAGYISPEPRKELFAKMDATNIDLKAFSEDFYWKRCGGHLEPVLETLTYVAHETDCWLEVTTLLLEGENDSDEELTKLSEWCVEELGPDVPLHFSAAHAAYKMNDLPSTSIATLRRGREIARKAGLHHVYTGNVHDLEGDTTFCPSCRRPLIERDWYEIKANALAATSSCPICKTKIVGRFEAC